MVLKIGDNVWKLHFSTEHIPPCRGTLWDTVTRCYVHTGVCVLTHTEPKHCVNGSAGEAKCSKKDSFNRRVGNRLALTNAIKNLPLEARKEIWEAYWRLTRRPKESSEEFQRRIGHAA